MGWRSLGLLSYFTLIFKFYPLTVFWRGLILLYDNYSNSVSILCRVADSHHFNADPDPDPAFHLNADPGSGSCSSSRWCESATTGLQTLPCSFLSLHVSILSFHASVFSVHDGPPRLHSEPRKLLNFDFNADPDPAVYLMRIRIQVLKQCWSGSRNSFFKIIPGTLFNLEKFCCMWERTQNRLLRRLTSAAILSRYQPTVVQ
jgi:hypothetical protein